MLIVGKPAMQNNTVSFYVLDTAQDFQGVDRRVFHSSRFVKRRTPNIVLNLIEKI